MTRKLAIIGWVMFSIGLAHGQAPTTRSSAAGGQLLQACIKGDSKQVAALLGTEADLVNVRRVEDGATPLHLAKNAAVAAILLENGADIEATDTETKSTPLHWALDRELWNGKSDTAAFLLDQGAKSDDLLCLCALGRFAQVKSLFQQNPALVNFESKPEDQLGSTPLEVAADYNHADIVGYLLDHGADVNQRLHSTGTTVMHGVAFLGRIDIAKLLLAHGATLDVMETRYHETPLGWAVYAGQADMVKLLIAHGAKVRQVDIQNSQEGQRGLNGAGQGATTADYKNIEKMLRAAKAPR